jgi:hypothetical protein
MTGAPFTFTARNLHAAIQTLFGLYGVEETLPEGHDTLRSELLHVLCRMIKCYFILNPNETVILYFIKEADRFRFTKFGPHKGFVEALACAGGDVQPALLSLSADLEQVWGHDPRANMRTGLHKLQITPHSLKLHTHQVWTDAA